LCQVDGLDRDTLSWKEGVRFVIPSAAFLIPWL